MGTKRFSRWIQTATITSELYFLPFVATLLTTLATRQPQLVFMMDGSEVGRGCLALVVSVLYAHRALPVAWLVVKGKKGHFPTEAHVQLLHQVMALVPAETAAVFLGDGEFDSPELQAAVDTHGWQYACRTAKNIQIWHAGTWQDLETIGVCRGRKKMWSQVGFTKTAYGPVQVIGWWGAECDEPLYLVTNFTDRDEACQWYQKHARIETLFSDQKSRGFHLNQTRLA